MPRKPRAVALPTGTHSPLLTSPQAAAYLGVATSTLDTWRSTKRHVIPFVKIGPAGAVRYRVADLDDFIAANVVAA